MMPLRRRRKALVCRRPVPIGIGGNAKYRTRKEQERRRPFSRRLCSHFPSAEKADPRAAQEMQGRKARPCRSSNVCTTSKTTLRHADEVAHPHPRGETSAGARARGVTPRGHRERDAPTHCPTDRRRVGLRVCAGLCYLDLFPLLLIQLFLRVNTKCLEGESDVGMRPSPTM